MDENRRIQNFWISILVIIVLPLMPIFAELISKQSCLDTTLVLTTAVYSITVLTSSNKLLSVLLGVLPCMFFAMYYVHLLDTETFLSDPLSIPGKILAVKSQHSLSAISLSLFAIVSIGFIHGSERYGRHVKQNEPFFSFFK